MLSILAIEPSTHQVFVLFEIKSRGNDCENEKRGGYIFRSPCICIEQHTRKAWTIAAPYTHILHHPITYSALSSLRKMSVTACEWMVVISASFPSRNATCIFACISNDGRLGISYPLRTIPVNEQWISLKETKWRNGSNSISISESCSPSRGKSSFVRQRSSLEKYSFNDFTYLWLPIAKQ